MAKGFEKLLERIKEQPSDDQLIGRFLQILAETKDDEEKVHHTLALANLLVGSNPRQAVRIVHMVYRHQPDNLRAIDIMIAGFRAMGKIAKAEVLAIEKEKILKNQNIPMAPGKNLPPQNKTTRQVSSEPIDLQLPNEPSAFKFDLSTGKFDDPNGGAVSPTFPPTLFVSKNAVHSVDPNAEPVSTLSPVLDSTYSPPGRQDSTFEPPQLQLGTDEYDAPPKDKNLPFADMPNKDSLANFLKETYLGASGRDEAKATLFGDTNPSVTAEPPMGHTILATQLSPNTVALNSELLTLAPSKNAAIKMSQNKAYLQSADHWRFYFASCLTYRSPVDLYFFLRELINSVEDAELAPALYESLQITYNLLDMRIAPWSENQGIEQLKKILQAAPEPNFAGAMVC